MSSNSSNHGDIPPQWLQEQWQIFVNGRDHAEEDERKADKKTIDELYHEIDKLKRIIIETEQGLEDSLGVLAISDDGKLHVHNLNGDTIIESMDDIKKLKTKRLLKNKPETAKMEKKTTKQELELELEQAFLELRKEKYEEDW
jgi:hypothetical protein